MSPRIARVSKNFGLVHSVTPYDTKFPLVAECCRVLVPYFNNNNITCPQLERHHMILLLWDRNWSQNRRTGLSIGRKVSQISEKCRRDRKYSVPVAPIAECCSILVQQFSFFAKCCRTKILRHSVTLLALCGTLRFN